MAQIFQVVALGVATLGTGAATMTVMRGDVPDLVVPEGNWSAGTQLDGKTFDFVGADLNSGEVLTDELVFRDGTFQSSNCQIYCDFGWSDYQTKTVGDVIHFTARTACPTAPHTVVWYGTVNGDTVEVEGTWTTRRWYWTHQIVFAGSGSAAAPVPGQDVEG
ncbi:hypothetical protein [Roseisalinus antarcticus]|uniref:Avidin family protein n=1 Tax=Roseisalinus antarcticus TaxID=254357 RepID=A0A1Y5T0S7_9RHOB|nr:hypothetical protein [Roseisalinus antarcticus]SLN53313.1 hypothetical protein ROA7023_02364 [Roseisalinus antarcticus]